MDYMFEKLTEAIKTHSKVLIMSHTKPDLDGMGSSIGLYKIAEFLKKECYIIKPYEKVTTSLAKGLDLLKSKKIIINFKHDDELGDIIDDKTLLIVLDTQKPELVESKKLLEKVRNIFVIDHHMNSSSHIKDCIFEYINANKSSIVEIITEYYKSLGKLVNPDIATIMLAGLEIDTNSYNVKTSEATFKASAYLLKSGANLIDKQNLLRETREDFITRQDFVKNSELIKENVAICVMDDKIHDNVDLAMISDELIRFAGIEASFTIGKISEDVVGVSARSIGNISVGMIMTEMGGGGHVTDAAAQIRGKSMEEVKKAVTKIVLEEKNESNIYQRR